ncbi:MAG: UDP-N-acetylmuramoyl-L-alanyl-D-glutamate--2,6-diaminopimelate ligase [Clostridiales bacterium]|nr:UDP-N-acetylmuramoyl-L-alanyl-D-glutamate--2,6-diaminopimelate ligase [Clostridiales bacterium]MDO4349063.1 UDP-N-acetylmuramoyl-L-alanyl-D-glutamate--2,6-diaminopimelate ligase [Eubacteriales bacterium]MDY4009555.1 UDP-N-acetylmuramoyl-L-alanyl-D-glutamate--2,6-diaminopimelate ligase [Candidatus Limiplasma sp.]
MRLKELLNDVPGILETRGDVEVQIDALVTDSRDQVDNGLFFCISGMRFDAHTFAPQAQHNGCVALVVERFLDSPLVQVKVENARSAMAYIASAFFGHPERKLRMVGVCGTKGKTTTSYLMKAILEKAGFRTGLIGTTGNMIGQKHLPSNMTTPDPVDLHRCLKQMVDEGVEAVSMEVSAHAVDMHRLDGITFEAACYTNFSQDHLDYFGTMERYFETKKSFFLHGAVKNASLNADDETSERVIHDMKIPHITYGISAEADVFARDIEISENGVSFSIQLRGLEEMPISMHLTGMFNVYNALAAASLAMILGIDKSAIKEGLESIQNVPGRVEMLDTHTPYKVILDYAHSPDALNNVLTTVRAFTKGRLIALFGCGGDRDHGKRPIMGEIVGRLADFSILTSDNPRTEDPDAILRSIEEGMKRTKGRYVVIENRREAIRYALEMGREGDVIILAGKGNETYQDIMGVKRPFDEKVVVRELLSEMRG